MTALAWVGTAQAAAHAAHVCLEMSVHVFAAVARVLKVAVAKEKSIIITSAAARFSAIAVRVGLASAAVIAVKSKRHPTSQC